MKNIIIAIDGYSSCGKSTLAKALAKQLQYRYIDTGAMYRAVTLYFIRHKIAFDNATAIQSALQQIHIHFENKEGQNCTFLNGEDVENEIRKMYVSEQVSPVATISSVRRAMVQQQQAMGQHKAIVMDGRDIGTVVFPSAELKLFLTAAPDIRAQRRYQELLVKEQGVSLSAIKANLLERDHIDSTRADSPLRQAEDAIIIDNSNLTEQEQLQHTLQLAQRHIHSETKV